MPSSRSEIPKAYLLTWTTYGTWLHGDERGSVSRHADQHGSPFLAPHRGWVQHDDALKSGEAVLLSKEMRSLAETTITEHCGVRGWTLHAVNVRTNHVHAVVSGGALPEAMLSQFKAWITRRGRERGLIDGDARIWTRHGSTRYLWDSGSVAAAIDYVRRHQD